VCKVEITHSNNKNVEKKYIISYLRKNNTIKTFTLCYTRPKNQMNPGHKIKDEHIDAYCKFIISLKQLNQNIQHPRIRNQI
jgi:hypothetical protein